MQDDTPPTGELIRLPEVSTVTLISNARRALAEAKTVADLRRVMDLSAVATDAAKRIAKLMEAQGMASEIVAQATEAANDAALVRIQAQGQAGRLLREMQAQGKVLDRTGPKPGPRHPDGVSGSDPEILTIPEAASGKPGDDSAGAEDRARVWRKVADVPDAVLDEYVAQTREKGGELTTVGLLKFAAPPKPEPESRDNMEVAYDAVTHHLNEALRYDSKTMAAYANNTKRRTQFRKLMDRMRDWVDKTDAIIR